MVPHYSKSLPSLSTDVVQQHLLLLLLMMQPSSAQQQATRITNDLELDNGNALLKAI